MNVKELKKELEKYPDDMVIITYEQAGETGGGGYYQADEPCAIEITAQLCSEAAMAYPGQYVESAGTYLLIL